MGHILTLLFESCRRSLWHRPWPRAAGSASHLHRAVELWQCWASCSQEDPTSRTLNFLGSLLGRRCYVWSGVEGCQILKRPILLML